MLSLLYVLNNNNCYSFSTEDCPIFSGCLSVNDRLKKSERLFENEIVGPEALTLDNEGKAFTIIFTVRDERCCCVEYIISIQS